MGQCFLPYASSFQNIETRGARGFLTVDEALVVLLKGTDAQVSRAGPNTTSIRVAQATTVSTDANLQTIVVEDGRMSADTLDFHHGKHHKAYVDKLNELTSDGAYHGMGLEDIIETSVGRPADRLVFNQAGQHWNHSHFWLGMKPGGGGPIPGSLEEHLIADFGSVDRFKEEFKAACLAQFGSGWAWLVFDGERLAIAKTGNADTPLTEGKAALLTCDVWEHSYYIDYKNLRPKYVDAFLEGLVDWEMVAKRYEEAVGA